VRINKKTGIEKVDIGKANIRKKWTLENDGFLILQFMKSEITVK